MKNIIVDGIPYKLSSTGTFYDIDTPDDIIIILEYARIDKTRLKFIFGNVQTGISWNEEYNTIGRIGRTTGEIKMPILLKTIRSNGGELISTDNILQISISGSKTKLYTHTNYKPTIITIVPSDLPEYKYNTLINGELYGRHNSLHSAQICKNKLL
jgi:hypothetical protein